MNLSTLKDNILNGHQVTLEEAKTISQTKNIYSLFLLANEIRENYFSNHVSLCSIVNAKSGYCPEDCSFCSQSSQFATESPKYKLYTIDELKTSIDNASKSGATEFSLVTSGKKIHDKSELKTLAEAIKYTKDNSQMEACTSLGLMDKDDLLFLKEFGMDHFHHNLETSRTHFPNIVSSHTYDEEIDVVKNAKQIGLYTCCGGIFGMGENWEQRIELAFDLRDLDVDTIPINFLNPMPGTPLASLPLLEPLEALKIVALYRFILPNKNIMVMGGREKILGDLQSWIFFAGANGMLLGNYLTTKGRSVEDDLKMLDDLKLITKGSCSKK